MNVFTASIYIREYANRCRNIRHPTVLAYCRRAARYNWSDAQPYSHTLIASYTITRAHMAAASLCAPDTMCGWGAWDARTTAAAHAPTRVPSLSLSHAHARPTTHWSLPLWHVVCSLLVDCIDENRHSKCYRRWQALM